MEDVEDEEFEKILGETLCCWPVVQELPAAAEALLTLLLLQTPARATPTTPTWPSRTWTSQGELSFSSGFVQGS